MSVPISLDYIQAGLTLTIDARHRNTLFDVDDAADNHEARYQLVEGFYYDYTFSDSRFSFLEDAFQVIRPHARLRHTGIISPNIYVGTLTLSVIFNGVEAGSMELEVQSVKAGYRNDYRDMLELIAEKCADLLMQANAPVSHHFDTDYSRRSETLYQRFAFVKAIIGTDEFAEAVHRVVTAPVTKWREIYESRDIRQARRFTGSAIKELVKGNNRVKLPSDHYLRNHGLDTLPEKIPAVRKTDSVDTPENRFVKHALEVFLKFCSDINRMSDKGSRLFRESETLIRELESQLQHSVFREVSRPDSLSISSPVLQRKEGYREILRVWLMFDLAARLIWEGGEDVYSGGKKDVAVLYEYWLFFKLLDLFQSVFSLDPKDLSELITETDDGLSLRIKQGRPAVLKGVFDTGPRRFNVRFNYNRSFGGGKPYPAAGSWTTTMRPDYTLSFWPYGVNEHEAEKGELIVHIHFDAKYKVSNLHELLDQSSTTDIEEERKQNRQGIYKNADLLKMHAYKDAIRRTGGAYVLYPGERAINRKEFHEIIPGIGAFSVSPSKTEKGIGDLKAFILKLIEHFGNSISQRERQACSTYDIHAETPEIHLRSELP